MGKAKDILNQKVSLSDMWQSFALSPLWSLFSKKKKEVTKDTGTLISYRNAEVIKLRVSQDMSGFEAMYGTSGGNGTSAGNGTSGGFQYEMVRKAMVNQLVDQLVKSDMIEWYKAPGYPGTQLTAELWVAKK